MQTLIDELLSEQSVLQTPVAQFSDYHDREPDLAPHYRQLIPLEKPGSGEQYAFEVALDRCTGCKACVSACILSMDWTKMSPGEMSGLWWEVMLLRAGSRR